MLKYGPTPVTVATIWSVALPPLRIVPTVQTPVVLLYAPWLGVAVTSVSPAGKRSLTATFVAVSGPALLTVIANVTLLPTFGPLVLTVFVSERSATPATILSGVSR